MQVHANSAAEGACDRLIQQGSGGEGDDGARKQRRIRGWTIRHDQGVRIRPKVLSEKRDVIVGKSRRHILKICLRGTEGVVRQCARVQLGALV